jgi:hypothetical protein
VVIIIVSEEWDEPFIELDRWRRRGETTSVALTEVAEVIGAQARKALVAHSKIH